MGVTTELFDVAGGACLCGLACLDMFLLSRHMAQSLRWREHPNWVLSMNERYLTIIASSLGPLVHRLDAEKLEATTGAAFDHLDAQRFRPGVRRSEDPEHGVQSRRESRGGGRVRLVIVGHDDDAHGVGDFARLVVGHLHGLCDGVRHVQRLVEVFVEFFGVLQCAVELDFAFAGRSVDEVLDGAEFGVLGVERDECGISVFHCLTFPRLLLLFFFRLMPKIFHITYRHYFQCRRVDLYALPDSILAVPQKSHTYKKSPHP